MYDAEGELNSQQEVEHTTQPTTTQGADAIHQSIISPQKRIDSRASGLETLARTREGPAPESDARIGPAEAPGEISQAEKGTRPSDEDPEVRDFRAAFLSLRPWQQKFIAALRISPVVTMAVRAASVSPSIAATAKKNDPLFSELWDDALTAGVDKAEHSLYLVGTVGMDVRALEIFLKANRSEKYREPSEKEKAGAQGLVEGAVARALGEGILQEFARRLLENGKVAMEVEVVTTGPAPTKD